MLATRMLSGAALVATLGAGLACGGDSTGPDSDPIITFPEWPQAVVSAFCVRGNTSVGEQESGSVTSVDCDAADFDPDDEGYFEVWRVRVATTRSVTFDANSQFDNYLTVLRVNSVSSTAVDVTVLAANDDRSTGNLNALVTVQLQPNVDYVVAVGGFDYTETGPYTLRIQ